MPFFKSASVTLCSALAAVVYQICTEAVHPNGLTAFVACCLIPLDKQLGVHPIDIEEVPRHIVTKTVLCLVDLDIREACSALQVCAGCKGGCKAAVHVIRQLFHDPCLETVLLVDASNAYDFVNRQAALNNILRLYPPLGQILINTYQSPVRLIIPGGGGLVSTEATTQGMHSNRYAFKFCFKWALYFCTLAIKFFNNVTKFFQAGIATTTLQTSLLLNASPPVRHTHF